MPKVILKSAQEIDLIRESGDILSRAHAEVAKNVTIGTKTSFLNSLAEEFIRDHKAEPSFLNFNGFPYTLCISLNDQVVHGFPSNYELKNGDIISIDCGVNYKGYYSDCAYSYAVGDVDEASRLLLEVTKESLNLGIEQAVVGNRIGDIGFAVQSYAEKFGFGVVRELVGHGVGKKVHEKPEIPNYGKKGNGMKLEEGMVLAIEPMINAGTAGIKFWDDGWTVSTKDKKNSAHFEHTVAVRKDKPELLTTFKYIEEVLNNKKI